MTGGEASGADLGDDEVGVDGSFLGVVDGLFGELAVVGPEGAVVGADVETLATGFEADAVSRASAGGVDGVNGGAVVVTAIASGGIQRA